MSRSDLEDVMWEAWNRVWPRLKGDADELRARLARRRLKTYLRPMRATCLAVRANDVRINSWDAATVPDDACYPGRPDLYREHRVYLDKRTLMKICAPARLDAWGEDAPRLAKLLGYGRSDTSSFVRRGLESGRLRVRYRMNQTLTHPEPRAGSRRNPAIYHSSETFDPQHGDNGGNPTGSGLASVMAPPVSWACFPGRYPAGRGRPPGPSRQPR